MKLLTRIIKSKLVKVAQRLDRENGFIGMLLIMTVSIAVFTILSSMHIYMIRQAKYQAQIREAYMIQAEIENFAVKIVSAYNRGRLDCPASNCCNLGGVKFNMKTACGANPTSDKQEDYECLTSSYKQRYCLVKIEAAGTSSSVLTSQAPIPSIASGTTVSQTDAKTLRDNLKTVCSCTTTTGSTTTYTNNYQYSATCQAKCNEISTVINEQSADPYPTANMNSWLGRCCEHFQVPIINCNANVASKCENYESSTSLSANEKMFCEICERKDNDANTKSNLFTYYVCPARNPESKANKADSVLKKCRENLASSKSATDKAKSGVFYQTFRLLTH